MVIIVSGCDRVGKTTFCTQLQKQLNAYYVHFSVPKSQNSAYKEYENFINQIDNNKVYVIDRFYECECIYAPIFRGYNNLQVKQFDNILRKKTKVLFIYIKSKLNIIKQRITDIGDDYINIGNIEKIYYLYQIYMEKIQLPYIILNNNYLSDLNKNVNITLQLINNYNFIDDYYGNLQAKKAIIFSQEIQNKHDYILNNICPIEKLDIRRNRDNIEQLGDYIFTFFKPEKQLVTYTDYFYTNNDYNANILNINERLYLAK